MDTDACVKVKVVIQPLEVLSDSFSGLSERGSNDGREDKVLKRAK